MQVMDRMCQMLHTKAEDLRIHNFVDEEHPDLLEDEEKTIDELGFSENHKLLIESKVSPSVMIIVSISERSVMAYACTTVEPEILAGIKFCS